MRLRALAAAIAVLTLVSGCAPQPVEPLKPVTPIPERAYPRLFETPEEALAAAEKAYADYQGMSNLIASEGGKDPERIAPFVTEAYLDQVVKEIRVLAEAGWRTTGPSLVASTRLQQWFMNDEGSATIVTYVCVDVSSARLVDTAGVDVTPDRDERGLLQVTFEATSGHPVRVVLAGSELWRRGYEC